MPAQSPTRVLALISRQNVTENELPQAPANQYVASISTIVATTLGDAISVSAKVPGPDPRPAPHHWKTILDDYLDGLAAAGYPATTRATRSAHLRRIARGIGVAPEDVTGASLNKFFAAQKHWARETRRGYRNSCVSFFGWAHVQGRILTNPALELPSVKASPPAPRPAPDRVYREAMMAATPREMLMLRLADELGLRRGEVAQVSTADLDEGFDGYELVVHGKGGKLRTLPVPDELGDEIARGPAGHTPGAPEEGWLFPNLTGGHLSAPHVGKICSRVMPGFWTMHKLRHRFATKALRGTRNILAVRDALGHASVATTQLYTATDMSEVRAAVMAAVPEQFEARRRPNRMLGSGIAALVAIAALVGFSAPTPDALDEHVARHAIARLAT